ncbi:MAG TPA: hypothetical protein O0X23_04630, partial [Methanocorpusculum sp.]|nr:hypothetical protein [Methanocorpusculum sp.]
RYVWHNVNVICPTSDLAEDIAKQEISIMAIAAGLSEMRNTNELIGKIVTVRITHYSWMDQNADGCACSAIRRSSILTSHCEYYYDLYLT